MIRRNPRPCTCTLGQRCDACHQRGAAVRRLFAAAPDAQRIRTDPVTYWDARTSLADARAALCLAVGVPVEWIDPAGGYDRRGAA